VNHAIYREKRKITWESIIAKHPTKIINLVDLCGHEKYLKTTVHAVSGDRPDYAMVIVAANDGLLKMTYEHLSLLIQFHIPFFFVVTKLDIAQDKLKDTLEEINTFLKRCKGRKMFSHIIRNSFDLAAVRGHSTGIGYLRTMVPIFCVSSVTGENIDLLSHFIGLCPRFKKTDKSPEILDEKNTHAVISEHFRVTGIGTVVLCEIKGGILYKDQILYLGPIDSACNYIKTKIKGIHRRRYEVTQAETGQTVTCALQNVSHSILRSGLILCSKNICETPEKRGCWEFDTEVSIISSHALTIYRGYQPILNIGTVRQACKVMDLYITKSDGTYEKAEFLRNNDKGVIRFRFSFKPEHILVGTRMVAREGRLRVSGYISSTIPLAVSEQKK